MPGFLCTRMAPIIISLSRPSRRRVPIYSIATPLLLLAWSRALTYYPNLTLPLAYYHSTQLSVVSCHPFHHYHKERPLLVFTRPHFSMPQWAGAGVQTLWAQSTTATFVILKPQQWVSTPYVDHRDWPSLAGWRNQSVLQVHQSGGEKHKKVRALRFRVSRALLIVTWHIWTPTKSTTKQRAPELRKTLF